MEEQRGRTLARMTNCRIMPCQDIACLFVVYLRQFAGGTCAARDPDLKDVRSRIIFVLKARCVG